MKTTDKILVLDFGGQYDMLIARRVREHRVYAEIKSYAGVTAETIEKEGYKGIIFTGGPASVYDASSPHFDPAVLNIGVPILGICYGAQLMAYMGGGEVGPAFDSGEYGRTELFTDKNVLFDGVPEKSVCFMSHTDSIVRAPEGFSVIARTQKCPCAAMCDERRRLYAVQFHPEVTHTEYGKKIIENFIFSVCRCKAEWRMDDFIEKTAAGYAAELRGQKVLLALSGGVDSSVAAALMHKAVGDALTCVFVDHGLLRKNEGDLVEKTFREKFGMKLVRIDAKERFLKKLAGVTEPEKKRRIIGEEFIRVFEEAAKDIGKVNVLVQGTIYPDVVESGKGGSAVIKSHHNVGGLPDVISFDRIVEPLRDLFKDEVREVGSRLGLPDEFVKRQPFPGPGLAVRVIGDVTEEKLSLLREADAIFREEMSAANLSTEADQYFAVLTDLMSVGVKGDARTYGRTVVLRAVTTEDFMTAEWCRLPWDVLARASGRITNEVPGVARVVYDVTSKPPATVEWE